MSEAVLDAPITESRSTAPLPKSSKDNGLKGMAASMTEAIKGADAPKVEKTEVATDKVDTGLLGKIETPKEVKKTTREDDLKALKTARDEHEKNWKTATTELETLKKTWVAPERLSAAEKRATEFESRLEIQKLEDSPKFAREYTEPRIQLIDQAKELAKEVLGDDFNVERAMGLMGKARREFLDEAFANSSPSALAELAGLLTSIDTLDRRKTAVLGDWKKQREQMSEQERAQAMREAEDGRNEILRAFDASKNEVAQKIPGYREIMGDEAHNQAVAEKFERARKLLTGDAPIRDQATAAYLAVECADALKRESVLTEENAKLTERLKKFEQNTPGIGSGSDARQDADTKPKGMIEFMGGKLRGQ